MRIIERIGGLLIRPKETMKIIVHGGGALSEALIVLLIFSVSTWLAMGFSISRLLAWIMSFIPFNLGPLVYTIVTPFLIGAVALLGIISDCIDWLARSVTIHIVAKALGGGGDLEPLMVVTGYSWVRRVFPLAALIVTAFAPIVGILLSLALVVVSWIWAIYAVTIGVAELHGLSTEKALLATLSWSILKLLLLLSWSIVFIPLRFFGW